MNIHSYTVRIGSISRQMESQVKDHIAKFAVKVLYLTTENQVNIPGPKDSLLRITHAVIDADDRLAFYDDEEYGVGHSELSAGQEVDLLMSCVEQVESDAITLAKLKAKCTKKRSP